MDWDTHARRILTVIGEDATYTPAGGGSTSTVRGAFQQPYREALMMESSAPTFSCMAADVPGIKHGATFALRSLTFKVSRVEPDPVSGLTLCTLEKQ